MSRKSLYIVLAILVILVGYAFYHIYTDHNHKPAQAVYQVEMNLELNAPNSLWEIVFENAYWKDNILWVVAVLREKEGIGNPVVTRIQESAVVQSPEANPVKRLIVYNLINNSQIKCAEETVVITKDITQVMQYLSDAKVMTMIKAKKIDASSNSMLKNVIQFETH